MQQAALPLVSRAQKGNLQEKGRLNAPRVLQVNPLNQKVKSVKFVPQDPSLKKKARVVLLAFLVSSHPSKKLPPAFCVIKVSTPKHTEVKNARWLPQAIMLTNRAPLLMTSVPLAKTRVKRVRVHAKIAQLGLFPVEGANSAFHGLSALLARKCSKSGQAPAIQCAKIATLGVFRTMRVNVNFAPEVGRCQTREQLVVPFAVLANRSPMRPRN
jgi:hypothetical protein